MHTVVSFDFAVAIVPGWHTTIFPPYFVAGAIYSGFAMVLTLAIPIRAVYGLEDFITMRHLQNMAKVMLVTGLIVAYGYMIEAFIAWYSGDKYEGFMIREPHDRAVRVGLLGADPLQRRHAAGAVVQAGPHAACRCCSSSRSSSTSACGSSASSSSSPACTATSCPRRGACSRPTFWDWSTFVGTIGLFLTLLFLFLRFLPMISIFEMRTILPEAKVDEDVRVS